MVSRGDRIVVLWPQYFDASLSREEGRRVPLKYAIKDPTVDEIAQAAKSLGYDTVIERDVRYPARWWEKKGRVLVRKTASKQKILHAVSRRLAYMRSQKGEVKKEGESKAETKASRKKKKKRFKRR